MSLLVTSLPLLCISSPYRNTIFDISHCGVHVNEKVNSKTIKKRRCVKVLFPKCFRQTRVYMLISTYAPVPTPALHCIPPYRVRIPTKDARQNTSELHMADYETIEQDSDGEKQARTQSGKQRKVKSWNGKRKAHIPSITHDKVLYRVQYRPVSRVPTH